MEAAVATGDSGAVSAEIERFGLLLLKDEEEYREVRRQALAQWVEPVITVCVEEFDVFPRYITMICHASKVVLILSSSLILVKSCGDSVVGADRWHSMLV